MKQNHTDITIVLDRSGSMSAVDKATIEGFNKFVRDQQTAPGTATISLHQFDDIFETVLAAVDIRSAKNLTQETFVPRGTTALLDAIGTAINSTGERLRWMPEPERASKVVFVIITDGLENASHTFTRPAIFELIKHQRDKYAWEFVFLGANQDAIATATAMGIPGGNAMKYAHNAAGTDAAFHSTSSNLVRMRSGDTACMAFNDDDHHKQSEAGV